MKALNKLYNILKTILITILEVCKLPLIIIALLFDCDINMEKDNNFLLSIKIGFGLTAAFCDTIQMIMCEWIDKLNKSIRI